MLIEFIFWFCCFLAAAIMTILAAEVVKRGQRIKAQAHRIAWLDSVLEREKKDGLTQRAEKDKYRKAVEEMLAAEKARPVLSLVISKSRRNLYRFVLKDKEGGETLAISAGGGHPEQEKVQAMAQRIAESRIVVRKDEK